MNSIESEIGASPFPFHRPIITVRLGTPFGVCGVPGGRTMEVMEHNYVIYMSVCVSGADGRLRPGDELARGIQWTERDV